MNQQPNLASAQSRCEVRAPKPGDYDRMADLAGQLGYPSTRRQVRIRLDEMANSNHYAVYVAELPGGRIAGWIGMYVFRSVEQDSCAGISGLIVDQEVRSREIGKVLLGAAEEWARSQGCDAISVHTNVTRERAHRFYARNGYEHIKTQKYLRKSL
jgi:GNAT superfamily N-acetyltransferase